MLVLSYMLSPVSLKEDSATPAVKRYRPLAPTGHGDSGGIRSPRVSGSPSIRFMFWIACPAAPFTRLSIADTTTTRSPPHTSPMSQKFEPRTSARFGRSASTSRTLTNGLSL